MEGYILKLTKFYISIMVQKLWYRSQIGGFCLVVEVQWGGSVTKRDFRFDLSGSPNTFVQDFQHLSSINRVVREVQYSQVGMSQYCAVQC